MMDKGLIIYYLIGIISALGTSCITYFISIRYDISRILKILCFFLAVFSCYMIFAQILKYYSLHFYIDFSHWSQVVNSIAMTGKPWSLNVELLVPGTINYLSVHFTPLIYVFATVFQLWPYNETILVSNFIVMISAAIPLYKLALTYNQDRRFALFVAVLLLWYPTFQYIVMYEFEMLRFSIPIILWMLYFWQTKKIKCYYFFVFLAILVREEVGLTILMFGIYLILFEREFRAGLITVLAGAVSFAIITQLIMPALRTTDTYTHIAMGSFSGFGNSIGEILINIIMHPLLVFKTVFQPIKWANVIMLFLPLLFIPFAAAVILISILGNLGIGLLSQSSLHISYMLFYVSPSIPFIFYAFIKGWPKFLTTLEKIDWFKYRIRDRAEIDSAGMIVVLSGFIVANVFFGASPISLQFWFKNIRPAPFGTRNFHYSVYKISNHHRIVAEFCDLIPDSAIVSAQQFLHPRLFKKKGTIIYPRRENSSRNFQADYVFFDKTNNSHGKQSTVIRTQRDFDPVEKDKENWELIKSKDGYFLYKRINNQNELSRKISLLSL